MKKGIFLYLIHGFAILATDRGNRTKSFFYLFAESFRKHSEIHESYQNFTSKKFLGSGNVPLTPPLYTNEHLANSSDFHHWYTRPWGEMNLNLTLP